MTNGLQRECPRCGELNRPDGYICLACGSWLVEPKHLEAAELERVLQDWYRYHGPRRVDDPERREAEIREWDEARDLEQRERDRVTDLWQRRRARWKGHRPGEPEEEPPQDILYADGEPIDWGDTAQGAPADTAQERSVDG